jgi:hypothetical protein
MTKKTVEERLNVELGLADDIISEFENPVEVDDTRIVSARRERGLPPRVEVDSNPQTGDLNVDYEYARESLYNLVERGNDALEGILELAKEMEHPRAYEVAGGLIKTVTDSTMELLRIQEKLQEMKGEKKTGKQTTNNNLYVGSTAELQQLLKGKDIK